MNRLTFSPSQKKAVEHSGGPLLVVAGPGSGKTRTLTARIAHLVRDRNVPPGEIRALTFTHRAADEMRERLDDVFDQEEARALFIGTFHAFGLSVIHEEYGLLGFGSAPILFDESDRDLLLRTLLAENGLHPDRALLKRVLTRLEKGLSPDPPPGEKDDKAIEKTIVRYRQGKRAENAVDFDDCITLPLELFRENPDRLADWRARGRHLFVDEYQDVNGAQVALLKLLAKDADSLMAIGDPDQAIYSFRGSDVRFFLNFRNDFPGSTTLRLVDNYRSTVTIVNASEQVIRRNNSRVEGASPARPRGERGLRLEVRTCPSDRAEAFWIAERVCRLVGGLGRFGLEDRFVPEVGEDACFSDIAVLYRLNAQAGLLCDALEKAGVPFQRVGTGAADRKAPEAVAGRAVLALARLAALPAGTPPPLTPCAPLRVLQALAVDVPSLLAGLTIDVNADTALLLRKAGDRLAIALPSRAGQFSSAAGALAGRALAAKTGGLAFLAAAPLVQAEDPYSARAEKVTLSSIHAAKGLEFSTVFIAGVEEGLLPFIRGDEADRTATIEEERRLLYVGMTRARNRLFLTAARRRFLFGRAGEVRPSPFLGEISGDLVRFVRKKSRPKKDAKKEGERNQGRLF
jgi:DNA helicase II / ATP-dependent DNA helicase PcrA